VKAYQTQPFCRPPNRTSSITHPQRAAAAACAQQPAKFRRPARSCWCTAAAREPAHALNLCARITDYPTNLTLTHSMRLAPEERMQRLGRGRGLGHGFITYIYPVTSHKPHRRHPAARLRSACSARAAGAARRPHRQTGRRGRPARRPARRRARPATSGCPAPSAPPSAPGSSSGGAAAGLRGRSGAGVMVTRSRAHATRRRAP
jgi:hypothetical protein